MKIALIFLISMTTFIFLLFSCKKSGNNGNIGCGCNTDSVRYVAINQKGMFRYDSIRNGWGITIQFPRTTVSYECKICNTDLSSVADIINTHQQRDSISIIFTGKLKHPCPEEIDFIYIPERLQFDITIDSLTRD
jgi:hypothetical protein